MTHTPLHSSRGRRKFSQRVDPSLLRSRDNINNMDRGIANPHLGFPRRGLRTGSDPRINNTAGRMMQYSPTPPQASRYSIPPFDDTVTEIPIDTPMINPRGVGILNDARTMANDLFSGLTPEELENNRLGPRTLPAEQYQNPYFGQKQWNPDDIGGQTWDVDYTTEDITETERPPWDNWFGNLIRNLRGRNRGGLASLKYAR
jgi:hypothetical protein